MNIHFACCNSQNGETENSPNSTPATPKGRAFPSRSGSFRGAYRPR
ncbi:hypothetical protein VST7929_03265 [Vibrio stylophorae]|uniref:Uncharacterized protein n=1 Tax=Vibrio stylophorae TaxID=659351 RepID=A0ABN8DZU2_9VIBR|nr:hypothetical protein VST7929_03265 [Vibrio stylophorae]